MDKLETKNKELCDQMKEKEECNTLKKEVISLKEKWKGAVDDLLQQNRCCIFSLLQLGFGEVVGQDESVGAPVRPIKLRMHMQHHGVHFQ